MSTVAGLVAFAATYAITFEALTFWQTMGVSLLAQMVAFGLFCVVEERL